MIRILFLANAGSIHTVRWVNAIADNQGYEVHLISQSPALEKIHSNVAVRITPVPTPFGYFLNAPFVRRVIQEVRPRLVHAHYVSGYGTLARLTGFHPLVLSVWGSDIYDFPRKSVIHRWLIKRNLANADKVLSTSHVMADHTQKYTDKHVAVTPFGVDLERFQPKVITGYFNKDDIVIGTIKTLDEKYGIEFLIRAFKLLRDKHTHLPLKLLIVGGGPREAYLKQLAVETGIAKHTVFTGHILHSDIPMYFNMLSVAVFVSVMDSESFGVSAIEASACEKPVVVSNMGGLPEVVEDGVTGIVVPSRDVTATATAIERLVLDAELRSSMGRAGRARIQRLYDWNANVAHMINIYDAILRK